MDDILVYYDEELIDMSADAELFFFSDNNPRSQYLLTKIVDSEDNGCVVIINVVSWSEHNIKIISMAEILSSSLIIVYYIFISVIFISIIVAPIIVIHKKK